MAFLTTRRSPTLRTLSIPSRAIITIELSPRRSDKIWTQPCDTRYSICRRRRPQQQHNRAKQIRSDRIGADRIGSDQCGRISAGRAAPKDEKRVPCKGSTRYLVIISEKGRKGLQPPNLSLPFGSTPTGNVVGWNTGRHSGFKLHEGDKAAIHLLFFFMWNKKPSLKPHVQFLRTKSPSPLAPELIKRHESYRTRAPQQRYTVAFHSTWQICSGLPPPPVRRSHSWRR